MAEGMNYRFEPVFHERAFRIQAERIKKTAPHYGVIAVTGAGDNEKLLPMILGQSSPNA